MSYPNPPEPPPGGNYPPPNFPPPGGGGYPPPGGGGYPPPGGMPPQGPPPDNYLIWGILTTVFCCLPFGIVSIVKASKVQGLWFSGQFAEAQQSAAEAKKWAIISAVAGPVIAVVLWILLFAIGAFAVQSGY